MTENPYQPPKVPSELPDGRTLATRVLTPIVKGVATAVAALVGIFAVSLILAETVPSLNYLDNVAVWFRVSVLLGAVPAGIMANVVVGKILEVLAD